MERCVDNEKLFSGWEVQQDCVRIHAWLRRDSCFKVTCVGEGTVDRSATCRDPTIQIFKYSPKHESAQHLPPEEFRNSHGGAGTGSSYLCNSNCDMFKVTL